MAIEKGRRAMCTTVTGTDSEKWSAIYGTEIIGNLSQFKVTEHIGHSYSPCPYSTQADDIRTRILLNLGPASTAIMPTKVDHTINDVIYYMRAGNRFSLNGFECIYPGCPFYLETGTPYFYV